MDEEYFLARAVQEGGKWYGEVRLRVVPVSAMSAEGPLLSRKGPFPSEQEALAWAESRKTQGPPWR